MLVVPGGEPAKNDPELVNNILEAIEAHGIDRHSYVMAIGGGAVLDMVGYAASIAHRGVRLIRVPTTVLSQNDSGIGVKNGINFFGKKNFLGAFDPPYAVINDAHFLLTLDDRDWRAGISEAIKVALIKDARFFAQLEAEAEAVAARNMEPMQDQIFRCAELHAEHIRGGDPFEKGSSRPLDFGHWAAHKLEQMTHFELRHGEAVAIGIALDVIYSHLIGLLDEESYLRVIRLIETLGFSLFVPELKQNLHSDSGDSVLTGLEEFREHLGGELTIMLIEEIGRGVEVHEMDSELIIQAIEKLEALATAGTVNPERLIQTLR
jgi:3-dehydroquinate synthase